MNSPAQQAPSLRDEFLVAQPFRSHGGTGSTGKPAARPEPPTRCDQAYARPPDAKSHRATWAQRLLKRPGAASFRGLPASGSTWGIKAAPGRRTPKPRRGASCSAGKFIWPRCHPHACFIRSLRRRMNSPAQRAPSLRDGNSARPAVCLTRRHGGARGSPVARPEPYTRCERAYGRPPDAKSHRATLASRPLKRPGKNLL